MEKNKNFFDKVNIEIEKTEQKISEKIKESNDSSFIFKIEIEEYYNLEKIIINNIELEINHMNNKYYVRKNMIKQLMSILLNKFRDNSKSRSVCLRLLDELFYSNIMPTFSIEETILDINSLFEEKEDKKSIVFYNKICEIEIPKIIKELIKLFNKEFFFNNITIVRLPNFILDDKLSLIKEKIFDEWSLNYNVLLKDFRLSDVEDKDFHFIYQIYSDFYDDRLSLFDSNLLSNNKINYNINDVNMFKINIFKGIYLSNLSSLHNPINKTIYFNNANNILKLFGINNNFSEIMNDCLDIDKNKDINKKEFIKKIFKEIIDYLSKDKTGKAFIFIIWNLSMVFNGIVIYDNDSKIIAFSPLLKFSIRLKIFLYNFLNTLDYFINNNEGKYFNVNEDNLIYESNMLFNNSAIYYYYQIENFVFAEIIKSYTKVIYDQQNKFKINLNIKKIIKLLEWLNNKAINNINSNIELKNNIKEVLNNKINEEEDDDDLIKEGLNFSTLDEIESIKLYQLYVQFMNKNTFLINKNKQKERKRDKIKNLYRMIKKDENEIVLHYQDEILIPIDILNCTTQIMICITESEDNKDKNNSELFRNILKDKCSESYDYYIYKWNKFNDLKRSATMYGKLLAYIISSREVFKFQSISFLSLGQGSLVLESLIDELLKITNIINLNDLIQDIILIDSPISNINKFFNLVAGNIINVYKDKKNIIKENNNENKNGYENYIISDNKNEKYNAIPKIYNFDLINDFKISNNYYFIEINTILRRIREELNNNQNKF